MGTAGIKQAVVRNGQVWTLPSLFHLAEAFQQLVRRRVHLLLHRTRLLDELVGLILPQESFVAVVQLTAKLGRLLKTEVGVRILKILLNLLAMADQLVT